MKSNTQQRIISALILVAILVVCIYFGAGATLGLVLAFAVLTLDEFYTNFLEKRRFSKSYFFGQLIMIASYVYFNFFDKEHLHRYYFVNAGVFLNLLFIIYLFAARIEKNFIEKLAMTFPIAPGLYVGCAFISLGALFHFEAWRELVLIAFFVNFGMDTGAWFFGKNFGKRKLWPAVSPNKTVEGLIGGMVTSGVSALIVTYFVLDKASVQLFVIFSILGLLSQIGDLIQSKMKRQFALKDSSSLIPGHGGVYDRIDSLMFLAPFFALTAKGLIKYLN